MDVGNRQPAIIINQDVITINLWQSNKKVKHLRKMRNAQPHTFFESIDVMYTIDTYIRP